MSIPIGASADAFCRGEIGGLELVKPRLANLHVFSWTDKAERLPLAEGEALWKQYFALIDDLAHERYAMIEFVQDDDPHQLLQDAKTLHRWLADYL